MTSQWFPGARTSGRENATETVAVADVAVEILGRDTE